jgi:phosphoribosylformylglycinamidine synthase
MNFGIVVYPGTWSDSDCLTAVTDQLGQNASYIWHKDRNFNNIDCLILPGGFSYGDYLRPGAIARFSNVADKIIQFGNLGKPIIGICNGFQILCELGLLPGTLLKNDVMEFRCEWTNLKIVNNNQFFARSEFPKSSLQIPISHGSGRYYADKKTISQLEKNQRIIFKYSSSTGEINSQSNPNGSINNIAGIVNSKGNILGMMPHPERCCDSILGGEDGKYIFSSIIKYIDPSNLLNTSIYH